MTLQAKGITVPSKRANMLTQFFNRWKKKYLEEGMPFSNWSKGPAATPRHPAASCQERHSQGAGGARLSSLS